MLDSTPAEVMSMASDGVPIPPFFGARAPGSLDHPLAAQPMRRRLLELIAGHPGIHASELCREAGEPWGTVQYHLSLLQKGALVSAVHAGRERRLFPSTMEPARMRLLALMNQGRRQEIADFIRGNPGARQVDVCAALDLSRKTFRHAVQPMMQEGLIHERRGLQSNRYFPLEGLVPLMDQVEPISFSTTASLA